jgi:CRISPR-associated protein Cas1
MAETMERPDVPDLVPARMVNEFTYCQRLFFLEWVQARFADNVDTIDGRWKHRRVDRESGAAPLPDDDGSELRVARSITLSSERLGLVAKADLIEGAPDGEVVPVDYKRGSPPDNPERSWEPERVQLCVVGLLLADAGYRCTHGYLYFVDARTRVRVEFDEPLVTRTRELVDGLRRVAGSDEPPPPLVESPKCPRCSLVGLCLPDETNALAARSETPPRRLIPSRDDAYPLYVTEQGAWLRKDKQRLTITKDREEIHSVRLLDVSQVNLYGNVQVSTQVLRELMAREIPVCYFSYGGWFSGMAHGLPSKHVELRRRQVAISTHGGLPIARRIIAAKIANSRTLLRRNSRRKPQRTLDHLKRASDQALEAETLSTLLGIEGAAARTYFGEFPGMLRAEHRLPGSAFSFENRNRRPPRDAVNCLLSYGYGLLVKDLTATVFAVGFDPYVGFYHRPRYGRPALALDLAEEFRPLIVESVVITLINNGEVGEHDFVVRAGGVTLTQGGRKAFLQAYERRLDTEVIHPIFKYRVTYRRILETQARLLGAVLLGEIPEYTAIRTR